MNEMALVPHQGEGPVVVEEELERPTIFFVAYRPFDLRLFLNTGIVNHLAGAARIVVLGPEAFRSEIEAVLPVHARFETLQYRTHKVQGTKDISEGADG